MTVFAAVGFVETLRRSGHPVSLTSSRLFTDTLAHVDLARAEQVYWAARASLVHRPEDVAVFDGIFAAYWGGLASGLVWRPPHEPPHLTIALDDPDQLPDGVSGPPDGDDTTFVRYSAVEVLGQKDFADYTDEELDESRRLMAQLRLGGADRPSRRRRPHHGNTGPLDMRRTVRRAMRSGGETLSLARTRHGTRPRRLVLLLDVSGSMEPYARALIRFVHATVAGRRRVEAFALGTRLTRLTRELSTRDPDRALQAAALVVDDWAGGTRLGDGLRRFNDEWGCRGMARGATVVILSDGWDRGDPAEMSEQMTRLRLVAHRVVWVNPLKASPGYQPLARGMAAALPYVDDFIEGHCLDSLEVLAAVLLDESPDRPTLVAGGGAAVRAGQGMLGA